MKRTYLVIFEKAEKNWSAYFPQIGGCSATGKTLEHAKRQAREALEFHLEGLLDMNAAIPEPSPVDLDGIFRQFPFEYAGFVEVAIPTRAAA